MRRTLILTGILLMAFSSLIAGNGSPLADPRAIVIWENARITVLTDRLLRLEWSENSVFEDSASLTFVNRKMPVPAFTCSLEKGWHILRTDWLELAYKEGGGRFNGKNTRITLTALEPKTVWHPGLDDNQNLKGTTRTLDETEGAETVTLEPGIISRSGWAVVDDSGTPLLSEESLPWAAERQAGKGYQDIYFFGYGHDYRQALQDFTLVAGRIPLPPRYTFGYWWSRYWTYSDTELRALVQDFKEQKLPLDVLVIDMDWHETFGLSLRQPQFDAVGERKGWTGYTWNKKLFPDPEGFLDWAHAQGLKVALNLHPASGITSAEDKYESFRAAFDPESKAKYTYNYALEDSAWARAYLDTIIHPLEKQGVDLWWLDWQAWRESRKVKGLSNTFWLNHVFFTDAQSQGQKRPLILHRWGGLGNHRYQIGFSGDTFISWKSLEYLPYFTATAGNVGYGYWSHDIGGHMGEAGTPELYLRWLQYGVFSPILRTHATKNNELERRVWMFPELGDAMKEALLLRHALVPYIYSQARKCTDTGISLCRPLYWDEPESVEAYDNPDDYYFGDDLLACPVTQPTDADGLVVKDIWLPKGKWFDTVHGALIEGGQKVTLDYALDEIPLFARAGAVIPKISAEQQVSENPDAYILDVYPGADGGCEIYEDDGVSQGYLQGIFATFDISQKQERKRLCLNISERRGTYPGMKDAIAWKLRFIHRLAPSYVRVNGADIPFSKEEKQGCWSYDGETLSVVVSLAPCSAREAVSCELSFVSFAEEDFAALDWLPGILHRLPEVTRLMKDEVNRLDPIANIPVALQEYGSLPSRLAYFPSQAVDEIHAFHKGFLDGLARSVTELEGGDKAVLRRCLRLISYKPCAAPQPRINIEPAESDTSCVVRISAGKVTVANSLTYREGKPKQEIRFTLDGSEPDASSGLYSKHFRLARTAVVTARAYLPGLLPSLSEQKVFHLDWAEKVSYAHPCSQKYPGSGALALADGTFGSQYDYKRDWVGWEGADAIVTCKLKREMRVREISVRFLRDQNVWIFHPLSVSIEVSSDGRNYQSVLQKNLPYSADQFDTTDILTVSAKMDVPRSCKYLRVKAENIGVCPYWHRGDGGKAWVFMDEIIIDGE
jgi:alpha-glucosidase (family GH31 glycosyl hydrolase)